VQGGRRRAAPIGRHHLTFELEVDAALTSQVAAATSSGSSRHDDLGGEHVELRPS
jgi:hypothetical protein